MSLNIDKHATKAKEFIAEVAQQLGTPDNKEKTGRILTAVIYTLRDCTSMEETIHLSSQLPLFIKGVFMENWRPAGQKKRIHHVNDFIDRVRENTTVNAVNQQDLPSRESALQATSAVFAVIKNSVSEGEAAHIKNCLPSELKELWEEPVMA